MASASAGEERLAYGQASMSYQDWRGLLSSIVQSPDPPAREALPAGGGRRPAAPRVPKSGVRERSSRDTAKLVAILRHRRSLGTGPVLPVQPPPTWASRYILRRLAFVLRIVAPGCTLLKGSPQLPVQGKARKLLAPFPRGLGNCPPRQPNRQPSRCAVHFANQGHLFALEVSPPVLPALRMTCFGTPAAGRNSPK